MRRAARVDDNHSEVKRAFEKLGCRVLDLSRVGAGCPDILVQYGGVSMLVEIKDGTKPPSRRKLTPAQQEFPLMARLVRNSDDVAVTVAVIRRWHAAIFGIAANQA